MVNSSRSCGLVQVSQPTVSLDVMFCMWVVVKIMVPFWGPLNTSCRITLRTPKGTIILTNTHVFDQNGDSFMQLVSVNCVGAAFR